MPARIIGPYEIHDEIGAGGMATVHLGKRRGPAGFSPLVAIKMLRAPYNNEAEFVTMLMDEARLAARVRHPNVAAVIDVVHDGPELLLVMEYVHGETLRRLLAEDGGPVPPPIASAIACGVLAGLHAAHEARGDQGEPLGVVHRDVTPHNVVVGVDGIARVVDFGIAKARGRAQATTQTGEIKGKLGYMPPEQLRGEALGRQTDLWAVGALFWELLAGRRLFADGDSAAIVNRILFDELEPPGRLVSGIPPALDAVLLRALARERTRRFATAREMELAIQQAIAVAAPPTVGDWVVGRAHEALDVRAKRIEAIAQAPMEVSEETEAPPASPRARHRAATIGVVAAVGLSVAAAVVLRLGRVTPAASTAALASVSSAETLSPPPRETTGDAPPVASSAPGAEPPAAPPARLVTSPAPIGRPRPPPASKPDCDPPYSLNARGEKVYKRDCFGTRR